MEELQIKYVFNANHFMDLLDSAGIKNVFTYRKTKSPIVYTVVFVIAAIIIYKKAYQNPEISWMIPLSSFFLIGSFFYTVYQIFSYIKFKKEIKEYISTMRDGVIHTVTVNETLIKIERSSEIFIQRWENVNSVLIRDDFITFNIDKNEHYFIAKSMSEKDYKDLQQIIESKMK